MHRLGFAIVLAALSLASPLRAACKLGIMADFPVRMEGSKAVTTLKINGAEAPFAIDTGAFYSIITPGWASQLKLPLSPVPVGISMIGVGGAMTPQIATVKSLGILGATIPNIRFLVDDNEFGGHTGLIGQNILGLADSEYDFAHSTVKLIRPSGCESRNLAYWAKPGDSSGEVRLEAPPRPADRSPIGRVYVNGVAMRAMFDTGAGSSLLDRAAARRAGVPLTADEVGVRSGGAERGIGRRISSTVIAPINEVRFGTDETIKNTRIRVGTVVSGYDMLIGADFFLAHHVYVAASQHKLYFTYNGGPVFNLAQAPAPASTQTPAAVPAVSGDDAGVLAREASARAARRDFAGALADLDRAVSLAPDVADYRLQRAQALGAVGRVDQAVADLDKAVALAPADARFRLQRAAVRIVRKNRDGAREDLATADKGMSPQADERLTAAALEDAADDPLAAIANLDDWIAYHREDNRRPMALNERCWSRVRLGRDLDKALSDCNGAHRASPKIASFLDSRGWLYLRRGDAAAAKVDFDAALALEPKAPFSLLGRSIAEARLKEVDAAKADRNAAIAARPDITDREKRMGLADLEPPS